MCYPEGPKGWGTGPPGKRFHRDADLSNCRIPEPSSARLMTTITSSLSAEKTLYHGTPDGDGGMRDCFAITTVGVGATAENPAARGVNTTGKHGMLNYCPHLTIMDAINSILSPFDHYAEIEASYADIVRKVLEESR